MALSYWAPQALVPCCVRCLDLLESLVLYLLLVLYFSIIIQFITLHNSGTICFGSKQRALFKRMTCSYWHPNATHQLCLVKSPEGYYYSEWQLMQLLMQVHTWTSHFSTLNLSWNIQTLQLLAFYFHVQNFTSYFLKSSHFDTFILMNSKWTFQNIQTSLTKTQQVAWTFDCTCSV